MASHVASHSCTPCSVDRQQLTIIPNVQVSDTRDDDSSNTA